MYYKQVNFICSHVLPNTPSTLTYLFNSLWQIYSSETSVKVNVLFKCKFLLNKTTYVHYRVLENTDLYKCQKIIPNPSIVVFGIVGCILC